MSVLFSTEHFNLAGKYPFRMGKVRDIYDLGDRLLLIAMDRISAFDVVLPTPIPQKGQILTRMAVRWFNLLRSTTHDLNTKDLPDEIPVKNHLVSASVDDLPEEFKPFAKELKGRIMIVDKCPRIPIEFISRGFIYGSFWKDYQKACEDDQGDDTVAVHGYFLPRGLQQAEELKEVIFTPSTKAIDGSHDINISVAKMEEIIREWMKEQKMVAIVVKDLVRQLIKVSTVLYDTARDYARQRGIIIADTKFEFGLLFSDLTSPVLVIIDELFTPDSSRFWPADKYKLGQPQESFDKQYVRDYLESIRWNKKPPAPQLPTDVVRETTGKYKQAASMLFDLTF